MPRTPLWMSWYPHAPGTLKQNKQLSNVQIHTRTHMACTAARQDEGDLPIHTAAVWGHTAAATLLAREMDMRELTQATDLDGQTAAVSARANRQLATERAILLETEMRTRKVCGG